MILDLRFASAKSYPCIDAHDLPICSGPCPIPLESLRPRAQWPAAVAARPTTRNCEERQPAVAAVAVKRGWGRFHGGFRFVTGVAPKNSSHG